MSKPRKQPFSLSFKVVSITESQLCGTNVFDTTLKLYCSDDTVTFRGNPWKVGTKVDFEVVKAEDPYSRP